MVENVHFANPLFGNNFMWFRYFLKKLSNANIVICEWTLKCYREIPVQEPVSTESNYHKINLLHDGIKKLYGHHHVEYVSVI